MTAKKGKAFKRKLTGNIGTPSVNRYKGKVKKEDIKRVLISRPNHRLGNLLLITPLVQEVEATFPGCKIDLFTKGGLGPIVFKNYAGIGAIIALPRKAVKQLGSYILGWMRLKGRRYDMIINSVNYSSSGRLSTRLARGRLKLYGEAELQDMPKQPDYNHIAKKPVYDFRNYIELLGIEKSNMPVPPLSLKLDAQELAHGKALVKDIIKNDKKTISIFTYATAKKCYSEAWWDSFYSRLQKEYAEQYNIIEVLPVENVSQIGFKAPAFYSKDVREIASVIANTEVFIGADSGIMHLASASGAPVVGLFSVTNKAIYEPYNKGSIAINTNESGMDEWIKTIDTILGK